MFTFTATTYPLRTFQIKLGQLDKTQVYSVSYVRHDNMTNSQQNLIEYTYLFISYPKVIRSTNLASNIHQIMVFFLAQAGQNLSRIS